MPNWHQQLGTTSANMKIQCCFNLNAFRCFLAIRLQMHTLQIFHFSSKIKSQLKMCDVCLTLQFMYLFTPAFLSFLFLYTDRMTSRFPTISATVVKISTPARVAATPGDVLWAGRQLFPRDKLSRQLKLAFINSILMEKRKATLKFLLWSTLRGKKAKLERTGIHPPENITNPFHL